MNFPQKKTRYESPEMSASFVEAPTGSDMPFGEVRVVALNPDISPYFYKMHKV